MNILSFGASASKHSINKQFAHHTAHLFTGHTINAVDLLNFPLPIYTIDHEKEIGIPDNAHTFLNLIDEADLLVISMAEHNGSYTAWFKNLFDWVSRINGKFLQDKKILLLSTSPGARGAQSVMASALDRFPRHGAIILASFSLPNFNENFDPEKGVIKEDLKEQYDEIVRLLKETL
jgi:NAD(P)H-dependent FMN reductase